MPDLIFAQQQALKADIQGDNSAPFLAFKAAPDSGVAAEALKVIYNTLVSPDFWVWNTAVKRVDIYTTIPAVEGTTWSYDTYKAQSDGERDAWKEIFMGGTANFGQLNNRQGVKSIFSGAGGPTAQRTHIFNVCRRKASRIEKLFAIPVSPIVAATGNDGPGASGVAANPALLVFDGQLTADSVIAAWNASA